MEILTIGFTKKSAEQFFGKLKQAGIQRLIDVRLNNTSTLAGFTRKDDLAYFLHAICGIDYVHEPLLAPDNAMLTAYRKRAIDWSAYESQFLELMAERAIEGRVDRKLFNSRSVLLCSEPTAEHCHRRLVAEYLQRRWGGVEIVHL
jgi:uncharacterized protein (DUF488 family)